MQRANRKKETVVAFLRSIPLELQASIERVCTDMYEGYTNAVKEEIAQARVVIDRFHVAKAYRECADKLRKSALRELKQGLEEEEYKLLKGAMWPFRRNAADLDAEQQKAVELLLECAPDLRKAYDLREELSAIFDAEHTKESGRQAITDWIKSVKQSGLKCFDCFLTALDNWLDEITNFGTISLPQSRRVDGEKKGISPDLFGFFSAPLWQAHLYQYCLA